MKTIKNTTIYKCIYCGKIYVRKFYAEKHHFRCKNNPKNIGICHSCNNIEEKYFSVDCFNQHSEWVSEKKSLYCTKKKIYLKPRWASDIEDYFCNEDMPVITKMPLKCKYICSEFDDILK